MIPHSELILNDRGAIYHLDLQPEELADTIITVGDPNRVNAVSKYFDRMELQRQHREFVTHTGYIGSKRISVVSTGIGPDNIDIVLNELDALVNIDFAARTIKDERRKLNIIRLGTSGSLQRDIPVDSYVVSAFAIGLDNLMHFYLSLPNPDERMMLQEFATHLHADSKGLRPYVSEGSIRLRSMFSNGLFDGITVTCPGFYGPQGRVLRAPLAFPNLIDALTTFKCRGHRITNFEMETSAIYSLGRLLGHNCLSISAIVANRISQTFSSNHQAAMDKLIQTALPVISAL